MWRPFVSLVLPSMFRADRARLPPAFEAYRLVDSSEVQVHTYPLSEHANTYHSNAATTLGYKELKARARQEPLATSSGTVLAYVSEHNTVVFMRADDLYEPMLQCPLPPDMCTDGSEHMPSVYGLDDATWIVSGSDTFVWVLSLAMDESSVSYTSKLVSVPALVTPGTPLPWYVVHALRQDESIHMVLQRARRTSSDASTTTRMRTDFDLILLHATFESASAVSLRWHVCCDEPCTWLDSDGPTYLIGSEAPLRTPSAPATAETIHDMPPFEAAPYAWSQTPDTVMLVWTLPLSIPKQAVRAHFSRKGLSLSLATEAMSASITEENASAPALSPAETAIRAGTYQSRALWADIDVDGSIWMYETTPSHVLLTLHLAKAHEGTRWVQVFSDEDGVLETLDPSDLMAMMEGTQKYAQDAMPRSSLLHEAMDEDDMAVGTTWHISMVYGDGRIETAKETVTFLAKAAPGLRDQAVLLQHDVDAHVFVPPKPVQLSAWQHTASLPGMAYVLASKREAHPVYMVRMHDTTYVLAVEPRHMPPALSTGSVMYMYTLGAPTSTHPTHGQCRVLPLGDASTGPVLGVSVTRWGQVVCLCSSALLVVSQVWPSVSPSTAAAERL